MKKRLKALAMIGSLLLVCAGVAVCANEAIAKDERDRAKTIEPPPAPIQQAASSEQAKEIAVPQYEGYYLLWHDEFDGDSLKTEIWNMEARPPGWTNNELQEYTLSTDNIFIRDGKLVLKAIKTQRNGRDYYTSGKVNTMGKKDFMYGKVVVSAKVPAGQGLWPAIWMMPTKESL